MRSNRKYYIVMIVAVLIAAVCGVASNERALLLVQNWLEIPAKRLRIGLAEFERPDRWLLIASRESPDRSVRLFGMYPSWFSIRPFDAPPERFYAFRLMEDPDRATVMLIETDAHQMNKIAEVMARLNLRKDAGAASPAKRRTFRGHEALEWRFSSESIIDIPTLRVTILMERASSVDEAGISLAEAK
jgi:hypothetical protein